MGMGNASSVPAPGNRLNHGYALEACHTLEWQAMGVKGRKVAHAMSKGSKRRRENTALVEANWPFAERGLAARVNERRKIADRSVTIDSALGVVEVLHPEPLSGSDLGKGVPNA
jgi:hypothetical protein